MIKLVIFDLDGILLDTERFNLASKIEEAHKLGFDLKKEDVCNSFGLCAEEANKYFKEIYGEEFDYYKIKGKRIKYILDYMSNYGIPFKKGAESIVKYLKNKEISIAIATTTPREFIKEYLKYDKSNFFNKFDLIITGDEVEKGKPNPDIFLKCCNTLNVDKKDCIVVEDSLAGIKACKVGNLKSIFIEDLIPLSDEIKTNATFILNNLEEIKKII